MEQAFWLLWYRRHYKYVSPTAQLLWAMTGYTPKDPTICTCSHSYGRHTNHPKGYGCCDCLCLRLRTEMPE